ncbi:uncharacterized protein LOC125041259 [Penaeus chinensis]|uniref:uncharacterized protein LOC125041259 n=1 Tax=Penaeus chinensis TaxID=139456 RepID=UPI001FB70B02|nr:uncharacterized protein LOC125041259 [Penaeus chinensis]
MDGLCCLTLRAGGGGRSWIWLAVALWLASGAGCVRTNVVAEVPQLDLGPLVVVTVALGDTARIPCRHPQNPDDTVNLVLWYLNHTSRPFLSYDARAEASKNSSANNSISSISSSDATATAFVSSSKTDAKSEEEEHMTLDGGGTFLVIHDVQPEDEAEYRCRVHFRLSPTWTQRLLLVVEGLPPPFRRPAIGKLLGGFFGGRGAGHVCGRRREGVVVNQLKGARAWSSAKPRRPSDLRLVTVDEGQPTPCPHIRTGAVMLFYVR